MSNLEFPINHSCLRCDSKQIKIGDWYKEPYRPLISFSSDNDIYHRTLICQECGLNWSESKNVEPM